MCEEPNSEGIARENSNLSATRVKRRPEHDEYVVVDFILLYFF